MGVLRACSARRRFRANPGLASWAFTQRAFSPAKIRRGLVLRFWAIRGFVTQQATSKGKHDAEAGKEHDRDDAQGVSDTIGMDAGHLASDVNRSETAGDDNWSKPKSGAPLYVEQDKLEKTASCGYADRLQI
jgi:hypothetical protein